MRGVLITGGSSQIGRAIAHAFAVGGDRIVGASLEPADDAAFVEHLVTDLRHPADAARAVRSAHEVLGRLDVVILAAAVMPVAAATETTEEQWHTAVASTLNSAFWVVREAPHLLPSGSSIVAVSSVNATLAAPSVAGYAAAKSGLEGLVRQLALQYGPAGIRVNAVAPGMIGNADLPSVAEGYPSQPDVGGGDVRAAMGSRSAPAAC